MKISHFALPNLLAGKPVVPEFIQDAVTPESLGQALLEFLEHPESTAALQQTFADIHSSLRQGADRQAAEAIIELAHSRLTQGVRES